MRNLILVHHPGRQDLKDFEEIAQCMWQLNKDVRPIIASVRLKPDAVPMALWAKPTLTVAFGPLGDFAPKRGTVFRNQRLDKIEELKALDRHGIPVPRWQLFAPGLDLDPADWGPAVVLKPAHPEFKGVSLLPTKAVRNLQIADFPAEHMFRKTPLIVQRFIDTGSHPAATRVLTLFGEHIHCLRSTLKQPRPELDALDHDITAAVVATNEKTSGSAFELRDIALVNDEKAIALARSTFKAFPGLPLQGCDVVHDRHTGKSYILEVNSRGGTWHFSSRFARPSLALISRQQRIDQFGAWDIAAKVLIEKTLEYAR